MIGQVSLSVAYGIDAAPLNDPNIALAETALQSIDAAQTKARILNLLPSRKPNQLRHSCFRWT
jgi:hypothetical protein